MFYAQRIENGKELLGTENQAILKVKTLRGIKNYFSHSWIPKGTWNIYRMVSDKFYNEYSFEFVCSINNF